MNHVAVKDIHKEYLMSTQAGRISLGNSTILGVDEFSIAKHHTYATVVVAMDQNGEWTNIRVITIKSTLNIYLIYLAILSDVRLDRIASIKL